MVQPTLAEAGYKPSAWQKKYHQTDVDWVLGAGSAGPGKSMCLFHEPFYQQIPIEHARCMKDPTGVASPGSDLWDMILKHPLEWGDSVGHALFLMRDLKRLKQTLSRARRTIMRVNPGAHYNNDDMTYTLASGYKYQFGHCLEIDGYERYDSNQYSIIMFDELTQFDQQQFDNIILRLRTEDPVLRSFLKIRAMSNPQRKSEGSGRVRDPFWVRKVFVDPYPAGNKIIRRKFSYPDGTTGTTTRIYLPAKLDDNPNKQFVVDYKKQLASSMQPHLVRAMLEGDWYVVPGAFYSEAWLDELHVCKPFRIPDTWKFFRTMDWGYRTFGCVHWWAIDPDDTMFGFFEYTFKGKKADVVALEMRDIERKFGLWNNAKNRSRISGPCDSQLWEERGDVGKGKATIMNEMGVQWFPADKRSRRANAERLMERLMAHNDNPGRVPGIVVFNNCHRLISTVTSIGTDPDDMECPADGKDDHWHDSILYGCAYASNGPAVIPSAAISSDEDDKLRRHTRRRRSRARKWGYGH